MNYYPRYPAHYVAKTLHLTMEQDGAYTRLLDWCYMNERPVPHEQRYSVARATKLSEKKAVDAVLNEFFSNNEDEWENDRVLAEIEKAAPRLEAAKANGRKGGRPRKAPNDENPVGNPVGFQNGTQNEPSTKPPQSPIPIRAKEPNGSLSARADAGHCPHSEIIALYHEILPANPRIKVWDGARADHLRARWREDPKRQDLDYWRRYFAHVAASPFLTGKVDGQGGRPFLPGLDWLVKASNFAKVIEGRYHDRAAA